ncbi:helix-turn-helix transcriptional regulator [Histophilus somni]|uniref:helix-turn-helix transcriptional regulator n=1 Tax=Histophilus somni TaxID=731 RepID=UPI003D300885
MTLQDLKEMNIGAKTKIYRLISEKKFPSPLKIGGASRWNYEDVEKWLKNQKEENTN